MFQQEWFPVPKRKLNPRRPMIPQIVTCDAWDRPSACEGMRYHRFSIPFKNSIYLIYVKHGCHPDELSAFWGEMLYCQKFKKPFPDWVRDEIVRTSIQNIVVREKTGGRPIQWERDAYILVAMDSLRSEWREERGLSGRKVTRRHYSIVEAAEKIAEEFAEFGEQLTASAIESVYYVARKRFLVRCIQPDGISTSIYPAQIFHA